MKRVVAVLLVVAMVVAVGAAAMADEEVAKFMDKMIDVAKMRIQQVKAEYDKNGELTDSQIEMMYGYYKLLFAAEMTGTTERYFPLSTVITLGNDANTEIEHVIDEKWLSLLKGEQDKGDFAKLLAGIADIYAK